jgi:hypothetical protein
MSRRLPASGEPHKERAHHVREFRPSSQNPKEIVGMLREMYSGRSSLRDAWLIWSTRKTLMTEDMLFQQLLSLGFGVEESTSQNIMAEFGVECPEKGEKCLNYRGFLELVAGTGNDM